METNKQIAIIGYGFVGKATEYFLHWCKPETDISKILTGKIRYFLKLRTQQTRPNRPWKEEEFELK